MEARFDFPNCIERVTGGNGSESLLVFGDEKTALMESGMAYSHEVLIRNIKAALSRHGRTSLDYITLSHSHYDHIGGVPYLLKEWPSAVVAAAEKTKKVFSSNGARATIKKLSNAAAKLYSGATLGGDELNDEMLDLLRVDKVVRDGDRIDLGGRSLTVIETKGHTDCSISFMMEPEHILFTSETTGVFRGGKVSSEIVKSYKDAMASVKKCLALKPKQLIIPHYGILPESETMSFFVGFIVDAELQKSMILDAFARTHDVDATVRDFAGKYWREEYGEHQPKEAFLENAKYIVRNLLNEQGLL